MEAGEGGRMKGIKKEGREAGKRCIAAGEKGFFQGRKEAISPLLGGGQEGEKRGKRGKKIVSR